jgi:5-enolpyruvylshikimate-3-phosphate synthase
MSLKNPKFTVRQGGEEINPDPQDPDRPEGTETYPNDHRMITGFAVLKTRNRHQITLKKTT